MVLNMIYNDVINITTESFNVRLKLKSIVSVVTGDSATGKTFLIKMLENLIDSEAISLINSNINIDDLVVCRTQRDIENLLGLHSIFTNKTIFIDRYDLLHTEDLDKFILSGKNRIVLMSHTAYEKLDLHSESLISIKYDKESRTFYSEDFEKQFDFNKHSEGDLKSISSSD